MRKYVFAVVATASATLAMVYSSLSSAQPPADDAARVGTLSAPDELKSANGRFQVSGFHTESGKTGYYLIDTATGELWMNYGQNAPSKVSDPLLK